ncbi:MAG: glutaredoxin family protein [Verrucomicrobiales bacterium]
MSESADLKLYTKRACLWCAQAVDYLKREGFEFEEIDVSSDSTKFEEMREISGQTYAPTLVCGQLLLADFGVDELETFLSEHDITP